MSIRDYLPMAIALMFVVAASAYEGLAIKDRWGETTVDTQLFVDQFSRVPLQIGSWQGEDLPVEELVRRTAGAVEYVSRVYRNSETDQSVTLWLIVGHSRDITRHTPNVCYPSSGFAQKSKQLKYVVDLPGDSEGVFYTAKFEKENASIRRTERVFWAWNEDEFKKWEAPDSQRMHYGLSRSLYKLYFTSGVADPNEPMEQSAAAEFAEVMLPAINEALFPADADVADLSEPDAA
ncbi:MAG: exosortase-associated EpsI family protein [Planctomycetota bacterium]